MKTTNCLCVKKFKTYEHIDVLVITRFDQGTGFHHLRLKKLSDRASLAHFSNVLAEARLKQELAAARTSLKTTKNAELHKVRVKMCSKFYRVTRSQIVSRLRKHVRKIKKEI